MDYISIKISENYQLYKPPQWEVFFMVPTERAVLASIWLVPLHSLGQEPSSTYYVRLSFVVKLPFSGVRAVYI